MEGYILTHEQKEGIEGKFYTPYQFFNCVQDINDVWFLFLAKKKLNKHECKKQYNRQGR